MLTDTQNKYLLAIYRLGNNGMRVRSTEVSDLLGVSKASTAKMSRRLIDEGYIEKAPYGSITLTEQGIKAANMLFIRVRWCCAISLKSTWASQPIRRRRTR